jgi:hypothetical protein
MFKIPVEMFLLGESFGLCFVAGVILGADLEIFRIGIYLRLQVKMGSLLLIACMENDSDSGELS